MAEISSVHIDIARLAREVYRIPDDIELAKWTRSLVECLVLRDHGLNPYGDFLLREVEEFRKKEADRKKKISKDSALSKESKDSALSDLNQSINHSNKQTPKKTSPASREPDPIWDVVKELFFPEGIAVSQRTRVGKITRDLKSIGATPEQIRTRFANMRRHDWGKTAGPEGMLNQWANLKGDPQPVNGFTPPKTGTVAGSYPLDQEDYFA